MVKSTEHVKRPRRLRNTSRQQRKDAKLRVAKSLSEFPLDLESSRVTDAIVDAETHRNPDSMTLSDLIERVETASGPSKGRALVAEFHKDSGGRLKLFALTVIANESGRDSRTYISRTMCDIEYSRRYGYLFDQCGAGGYGPISVTGIYFVKGDVRIKERPTQLVDARDKPPWRGKRTLAIRARNRTRRLRDLPKAFALEPGWDLLDWLEHRAINADSVWCSICRDALPDTELCQHIWWCDVKRWYSTPSERCKCENRDGCRG